MLRPSPYPTPPPPTHTQLHIMCTSYGGICVMVRAQSGSESVSQCSRQSAITTMLLSFCLHIVSICTSTLIYRNPQPGF